MDRKPKRYWLSFCDPRRPQGSQFLGVAIIEAPTLAKAIREAWRLKINPGGEVRAFPIAAGIELDPPDVMNRLLTREEAEAIKEKP